MLPSASIGVHTSVFEPIHGSYPQAAGKNIANPLATILSAALMFEYAFNLMEEGALIREAVAASMDANIVTEDIAENGKAYKTSEVGDWIAEYIAKKIIGLEFIKYEWASLVGAVREPPLRCQCKPVRL